MKWVSSILSYAKTLIRKSNHVGLTLIGSLIVNSIKFNI